MVRSIAVEDPWPTNIYWRMLLADGRVVQAPVTIDQLHHQSAEGLVSLCARAVADFCARAGAVPKPTHELATPDLAATIIGYRAWRLGANGSLRPLGAGADHWRGAEEVRATCGTQFHAAPDPSHHCGWNAWHEPRRVETNLSQGNVVGAVACRGRVEVHCDGFRAEWARPICLAYREEAQLSLDDTWDAGRSLPALRRRVHARQAAGPAGARDFVEKLAGVLRLPAVPFGQLEAFAREHGSPVPAGMRPPGA